MFSFVSINFVNILQLLGLLHTSIRNEAHEESHGVHRKLFGGRVRKKEADDPDNRKQQFGGGLWGQFAGII